MSQGLNDIKRRIKSVAGTRQITRAMELVAASKLSRAEERRERMKPYFDMLSESVTASLEGVSDSVYMQKRQVVNTLYIVLTSDRGLAGGYNLNVCREAEYGMSAAPGPKILAVGQRGMDYFTRRGYDLAGFISGAADNPDYDDASKIADMAVGAFDQGEADEVYMVYTEYVSPLSQVPRTVRLLPAVLGNTPSVVSYEPSAEAVADFLIPKYVTNLIYMGLTESSVSEHAARRLAMENATDSAEDMLDELNLKKNRARQSAVTQELSEIVGGAQAVSR